MKTPARLLTEDWIIVFTGAILLLFSLIFPHLMPTLPKSLVSGPDWLSALGMFIFLLILTGIDFLLLKRRLQGLTLSLLGIFLLSLGAQVTANLPLFKEWGIESVFFSVLFGLLISNLFRVPEWLRPAIQSEFYIKIGIVCLGATILFGEVLKSGAFGLAQALVVVLCVWYFAFRISRRMGVDPEMSTMLASSVSICGVSAAIATAGVIHGDNKKLSYIVSLVLVIAVPMMYLMPWLSNLMGLSPEVAGAWLGGTIDTTGAVAAAGTMLGEDAANTAIIVKSSQNVLLGVAAFIISLMWTYRGENREEKPTLRIIWDRFPKFVVGFVAASLIFSLIFQLDAAMAKDAGKAAKGISNTFFSIAFVCVGLETRFREIFSRENRKPLAAFLTAQGFNIVITLLIAWLLFGVLKPALLQ